MLCPSSNYSNFRCQEVRTIPAYYKNYNSPRCQEVQYLRTIALYLKRNNPWNSVAHIWSFVLNSIGACWIIWTTIISPSYVVAPHSGLACLLSLTTMELKNKRIPPFCRIIYETGLANGDNCNRKFRLLLSKPNHWYWYMFIS